MWEYGLSLAIAKTRQRILTQVEMKEGADATSTSNAVEYLESHLDFKLTFWDQIRTASDGRRPVNSPLLMSITHSILLCGC